MRPFAALAAILLLGCAGATGVPPQPNAVWVRSHNRSPVDVYLLCGDRDARWLGTVSARTSDALEIPASQPYCARGLNFFLVVQNSGYGYWVGPLRPRREAPIELVIEKYAGLSSVRVHRSW